jgi:hypothetical protein
MFPSFLHFYQVISIYLYMFIPLFLYPFVPLCVYPFVPLPVILLFFPFKRLFLYSFNPLFLDSFIPLFLYSFVPSFLRTIFLDSFIHLSNGLEILVGDNALSNTNVENSIECLINFCAVANPSKWRSII